MPFLRNLIIATILIGLGIGALLYFTGNQLVHPYIWYILAFFVLITFLTFYVVHIGVRDDPDNFQLYFFGSSVFRVLLCMGAVFFYVYFFSEGELQFTLNFFVIYFIYTGFEIYSLLSNLRRNSKKRVPQERSEG